MNFDGNLYTTKKYVTEAIIELAKDQPKLTIMDLAGRIDDLNKAWDELTDHLVRQRNAMEETIIHLHNVIAQERRPR
jgi:hypothetical protein